MKWAIYVGAGVGGFAGSYLPMLLWNADMLDWTSLTGGFVGTIVGLWAGYKAAKMLGE